MATKQDYDLAIYIASNYSVETPRDCAVFFAGGRNMTMAARFCRKNKGAMTLLHTEAHKNLAKIPLFGGNSAFRLEEATDISGLASARFAQSAKGDVTAFTGRISERSTFFTVELPILLLNDDVEHINGEDKFLWLDRVRPPILPRTNLISPELLQFDINHLSLRKASQNNSFDNYQTQLDHSPNL